MKMSTDKENDVILNSQSRNMMIISHAEKSYMIFDENTASNIKSEIDKAMEEALAQVPPEQRAMVERMMKQQMGNMNGGAPQMQMEMPKAEIQKVGRSDTINGISCEYYLTGFHANIMKPIQAMKRIWSSVWLIGTILTQARI